MTNMMNYTYRYQLNNTNPEHISVADYAYILFCQRRRTSILSCD